jgi:hypothetical protein
VFFRKSTTISVLPTVCGEVGGRRVAVRIIERVAEHYEAQEVEYGRVYRWCPETIVVECDCGKRSIFKRSELVASEASCGECGKGIRSDIREELVVQLLDENNETTRYPWRYWHTTKDTGIPF